MSSTQVAYRITITKEQPMFLNSTPPASLGGGPCSLFEVQRTRVSIHSPSSAGEAGAVQCAKDYLERFRVQTADYFGMPDHKIFCGHDIESLGTYEWEIGYHASMAELESGDISLEEESSPWNVVVMCCGTVCIEGSDCYPACKK